ncbi:response regulator [Sphingobacterium bovistauri]|uniref:Response regulator transcription factor n=1 Tax=Sphingobacterium bovistauri TaxID=2781959 RepID=A0ABS7Z453_9SPHI|nr:response regulator transcription factor [Sphingobacterium bovistauri]MCA5004948.1 response regulator transcription factor [Sphingobacterium bovistauri]
MKRIILIEDHPIVVFNLKLGLHGQEEVEIVETYNSGKLLLSSQILQDINLALLDINLPDINGFDICRFLKTNHPHIKIIGISSFEDYEHISLLLENGADGYIVKGAKNSEMLEAIDSVLNGNQYFCQIAKQAIKDAHNENEKFVQLTKREQKIIDLFKTNSDLTFLSEEIGEDAQTTSIFLKLLKEKIEFYNLEITLPDFNNNC